jgi:hypothetical protein
LRATYKPADDEVRAERKRRYLETWPVEKQMEALTDAALGQPGKLDEMRRGFAEIREALPLFGKGSDNGERGA